MSCEEVRELLSAYLDGQLSEEQTSEIEDHLNTCEDCRTEWEQLSQISQILACVPQAHIPEGFSSRLHEALAEEGKAIRKEQGRAGVILLSEIKAKKRRRYGMMVGLAAAFMVGFVSLAMYNDSIPLLQRDMAQKSKPESAVLRDGETESSPDAGAAGDMEKKRTADGTAAYAVPQEEKEERAGADWEKAGELTGSERGAGNEDSSDQAEPQPLMAMYDRGESLPQMAAGGTEDEASEDQDGVMYYRSSGGGCVPSRNSAPKSVQEVQTLFRSEVELFTDAINTGDASALKPLLIKSGKTDQLAGRAQTALSFYGALFGGERVSYEQTGGTDSSRFAVYRIGTGRGQDLEVSLSAENRKITVSEGILTYGYEVDQALKGTAYTLLSYTPKDSEGRVRFAVRIDVETDGSPSGRLVDFLCFDGKVTEEKAEDAASPQAIEKE